MKKCAKRIAGMPETIFAEMTRLALEYQAINLGQGFPDFPAPGFVKQAAAAAIHADFNQYAPGTGQVDLRQALGAYYRRHYKLDFDPHAEIQVCVGATEALFATCFGLLDPDDEVILFDPSYDSYRPAITFAGGVARALALKPPQWHFDLADLEGMVTPRTRMLLLNSPQNPSGKVFSGAELEMIADLCHRHDLLAVTDEVYEHLCFDGEGHLPLATLPGMKQRTLTVSSLGKSFGVTGWKVGWVAGPAQQLQAIQKARQFVSFCGPGPLQQAAATILEAGDDYYRSLLVDYRQRRDFLCDQLASAGLAPFTPAGSYFVVADISGRGYADDRDFCCRLPQEIGVAAVPVSPFYADPAAGRQLVRFAFCKSWPLLEEAGRRLQQL